MATASQLKLAVILHADVMESTALVRRSERIAHDRIQALFRRCAESVQRYGGHVRELRGDAFVAEFSRASDAVLAGLSAQQANAAHNAEIDDGLTPELRIGVALGEVVVADQTVTGAGVVLAQRIEQLAQPGGICITGAVREAVPDRLPLDFTALGDQLVKGFDEPVKVLSVTLKLGHGIPAPEVDRSVEDVSRRSWRRMAVGALIAAPLLAAMFAGWWMFDIGPSEEMDPASAPSQMSSADDAAVKQDNQQVAGSSVGIDLSEARSIAVLPFSNMSDDPGQEYFSDGLTEDIITDLARISGLLVIARNSTFVYKGRAVDVKTVGRELGVRYILEGSVRRAGERVRISAQLIDAGSGTHLWANRYDRGITDVFAVQDEVTRTIVEALSVQLTEEEAIVLSQTEDVGTDAYDLLLRGNEVMSRFTAQAMSEARAIYEQVVRLNPRYARAHANIAFTYAQEVLFGWTDDIETSVRHGFSAAEEAKRLDARIPQLHLALANLNGAKLEWEEAAREARRTIELEPSYADGHVVLAVALTFLGDLDGAASAIARAKRLNPHFSFIYLWVEARVLYLRGRYDEAVSLLEDAVERNPEFDQTHIMLAATYAQLGRTEDAQWEVEEILVRNPGFTIQADIRVRGFRDETLLERYVEGLRKAGLPE